MTLKAKIALACYLLANPLLVGLVYLFTPRLLPYHEQALGTRWEALAPQAQVLFLALLKVIGAGAISSGVASVALLYALVRRGQGWARPALLVVGLLWYLPTLYATLLVTWNTPGVPPWRAVLALIMILVAGFALSGDLARRARSRDVTQSQSGSGPESAAAP